MVGMADGFAQASGRTTLVNLHTAPGVGNAMGAIFNAQANHSPLLVTAGQQARAQITLQANLTNRDATRMPHPLVKWSYEPPRAEDVPLALAHGVHLAGLPPRGPVVRLAADGRLGRRARRRRRPPRDHPQGDRARRRRPGRRRGARRASWTRRRARSSSPAPTSTPPAAGTSAIALAERQRLPGLGLARDRRRAPRLPREPSELPRRPAAGDRPRRRDARGPRPDRRRRQLGLPLLPLHPRAAAARGRAAGRDHLRPRRGRRARRWATRSSPTSA